MTKSTFAVFGILAVLLMSLGMVSAADISFSNIEGWPNSDGSVNPGQTYTVTFDLTNTNTTSNFTLNWSFDNLIVEELNLPSSINNTTFPSSINITIPSDAMDEIAYDLKVTTNASKTFTHLFTSEVTFCNDGNDFNGENGTLKIKNFYLDYFGNGNDEEWEALDEIQIEVDVKNIDTDNRVNDIAVEVKILDDNGNDVTNDFDFEDKEDDLGRISTRATETATFLIKELPVNVEEGNYYLYVRAYNSEDESSQCVCKSDDFNVESELYYQFEVVREEEAVIVKDSDLQSNILASCGDKNIEVTFPVYNIGEETEEKVLVNLYSSTLGIDEYYVIDSLRSGKNKDATFFIDLPSELLKTKYTLNVYTFFVYDDEKDELDKSAYDSNSNDLDRDFSIKLEILSCKKPVVKPTVTANLESIAEAEKELIVKAVITNNGEDENFIISLSDFKDWATLVSISPQTVSIKEGESAEVIITLKPTTTGVHSFDINTIISGESYNQPVSVNIKEESGVLAKINRTMGNNAIFYISVGIAGLLIAIISVLIVKISRRKISPQF